MHCVGDKHREQEHAAGENHDSDPSQDAKPGSHHARGPCTGRASAMDEDLLRNALSVVAAETRRVSGEPMGGGRAIV
jgi:hypothetical protein